MTRDKIALVLSAGYFGFFAHAGFMRAIEERGIDYAAIAGSSAGAIVAALHASGVSAAEIIATLTQLRKTDFWDSTGARGLVRALLKKGRGWTGLLKGDFFERLMAAHLRVQTFEACPRRLYLTAFNLTEGRDETFYAGTIADKVRASCSYPFLIAPKKIGEAEYWDGGFLAKLPLETLLEKEQPDRIIIHYLPTQDDARSLQERDWTAFAMLEKSLTAARKEIEAHRLRALGPFNERIHWIQPAVPRLGTDKLKHGKQAVEAAYHFACRRLAEIGL